MSEADEDAAARRAKHDAEIARLQAETALLFAQERKTLYEAMALQAEASEQKRKSALRPYLIGAAAATLFITLSVAFVRSFVN